jgi:hypothetical protein
MTIRPRYFRRKSAGTRWPSSGFTWNDHFTGIFCGGKHSFASQA